MTRLRRFELSLAALLLLVLALDFAFPLPTPASDSPTLTVLAADGTPLRAWPGDDGAQRHPTTPEAVSPHYLQALLHYEDRWFYVHPGVNPVALARAAWQWARQPENRNLPALSTSARLAMRRNSIHSRRRLASAFITNISARWRYTMWACRR